MVWQHAIRDPLERAVLARDLGIPVHVTPGQLIAVNQGRDRQGRFGLMFPNLPAFAPPDELLLALAERMREGGAPDLDNPDVPAGFTFLGQFIDHDLTRDTTPLLVLEDDPDAITNFRSARFDLDSLYGEGPADQPELYDPDQPSKLRLSSPNGFPDLPRNPDGTAIIGDPRNDENIIVAQLHVAFILFHNTLIDMGHNFEEARRLTQWHFQWIVVHDFLPHVAGQDAVDRFLRSQGNSPPRFRREFYRPRNPNRPMMPLEYAVGAYRFGHSMVRPGYRLSGAPDSGAVIFGAPGTDLRGSRVIPERFRIDFNFFFEVPGAPAVARNLSRRMDARLAAGLFTLPVPEVIPAEPAPPIVSLAERNLLRGKLVEITAGQDVAQAMEVSPISNADLGLTEADWGGKAPLWFYILAESEQRQNGRRLGEVGGRIVAEVILGLLDADRNSYLRAPRGFQPEPPIAPAVGEFRMGDFLKFAGAA